MPSRSFTGAAGGLLLLWLALGDQAIAQPRQAAGVQSFPSDYFAPSRPADAYDMIRKLPGFTLIDVDDDVRGFSGSRGNVLFDGRAPSGKQESLEEALKRIPASSVLRIELIRGGAKGTGSGNFELVANVVRRSIANRSISVLGGTSVARGFDLRPDFRLELSNQWPSSRLEGAFALETDIDDESGRGSIMERGMDGNVEREERDEREVERALSADAEYKFGLAGGETVANLSVAREQTSERIRSTDDDGSSLSTESERLWSAEGGVQYSGKLGPGEIETIFVQRVGRLRIREQEEEEAFSDRTRTSETIGRAEYRRGSDELRVYGSIEAALNSLKSRTEFTDDDDPEATEGSNVNVGERRVEAALGATWKASQALSVEPSIRIEYSRIRATGDNPSQDSFLFLKPRARATWDHGGTRLQAVIEREAAQLDFRDFVTSAELDRDDVLAGAIALRPPTTWAVGATIEQRFWGDGSLSLSYRREWIDDVIDRVVIEQDDELFDAIGNIGAGDRHIVRVELTAPFERLGIKGMQLRAAVTLLKSRVRDPVTGQRRIISEDLPLEGELSLTHDIPGGKWSWGVDANLAEREREYRLDEVRQETTRTSFGAFLEFRPVPDWRIRAEAENFTSRRLIDERQKYDGPRSVGVVDEIEVRRIRTIPVFRLSVRRSFGGSAAD